MAGGGVVSGQPQAFVNLPSRPARRSVQAKCPFLPQPPTTNPGKNAPLPCEPIPRTVRRRCRNYIPGATPPNLYAYRTPNLIADGAMPEGHVRRPLPIRRHRRPFLPKGSPVTALPPAKEYGARPRTNGASRPVFRTLNKPVSPFVVAMCPAPPVDTPAGRECLPARTARFRLRLPPQASPAVYSGPTPRLQHFKHVGDQNPRTGDQAGC
jgi:hypothetical protein